MNGFIFLTDFDWFNTAFLFLLFQLKFPQYNMYSIQRKVLFQSNKKLFFFIKMQVIENCGEIQIHDILTQFYFLNCPPFFELTLYRLLWQVSSMLKHIYFSMNMQKYVYSHGWAWKVKGVGWCGNLCAY